MKIMAKIKELLAGREKLAKYDELTEWKEYFVKNKIVAEGGIVDGKRYDYVVNELPSHIKEIIVNALDAEIAKLDEE